MKFPLEFDALDLATDELKEKLVPVSRRLKEVEKERNERRKVRKRTKNAPSTSSKPATTATPDVEMGDASGSTATATATAEGSTAEEAAPAEEVKGGELAEESTYRTKELSELESLISPDVKNDVGCSVSGLYDLVGEPLFSVLNFGLGHRSN